MLHYKLVVEAVKCIAVPGDYRVAWGVSSSSAAAESPAVAAEGGIVAFDYAADFALPAPAGPAPPGRPQAGVLQLAVVRCSDGHTVGSLHVDLGAHVPRPPLTTSRQRATLRMCGDDAPLVRLGVDCEAAPAATAAPPGAEVGAALGAARADNAALGAEVVALRRELAVARGQLGAQAGREAEARKALARSQRLRGAEAAATAAAAAAADFEPCAVDTADAGAYAAAAGTAGTAAAELAVAARQLAEVHEAAAALRSHAAALQRGLRAELRAHGETRARLRDAHALLAGLTGDPAPAP